MVFGGGPDGGVWRVPAELSAQAVRGTLLGTITDQAGLALPGAAVTATEVNTNIAATTVTNESGFYTFTLRDGVYRVDAELSGFKKTVRQGIEVDVNTTVRVDLRLEVGVVEESITVTAQTPLLQTDRADTGRIIEGMQIQAVPLGFNRNFQGMLVTVPGATRPFRPHSEFFNAQDSLSTNVNGQSRLANNVQLDGVDNNQRTGLLTVLIPSIEAIESVSVSTGNYDAEFGRAGGAIANVTLKSGTNTLRAASSRSAIPRRRSRRDTFRTRRPDTKYLQSGLVGSAGRFERDRLFFFGDYQHTLDHLGRVSRAVTAADGVSQRRLQRRADDHLRSAHRQRRRLGRQPFPGNVIPADRISPIARAILSRLPPPNLAAAPGQPNHQTPYRRDKDTQAFDVKITQQIGNGGSGFGSSQLPEVRRSCDPPIFGLMGGGGKDFAGTGTNLTYSTGFNYNRVWNSCS